MAQQLLELSILRYPAGQSICPEVVMNPHDDILAEWKTNRFIIVDDPLTDHPGPLIVLCDVAFWNQNYIDLNQWCQDHQVQLAGMTVALETDQQLTAFCLRWR